MARNWFRPDPASKLSANLYDIPLLCVQWKTPDDEQRNPSKHVEFYSKNKFEKLVHPVGFIIRIYHDARLPERQKDVCLYVFSITEQYFIIFCIKKEKDRASCFLWRLDQIVFIVAVLKRKRLSVPMILSTVVVSRIVMVTTWPSAVQNCSVLVPTQRTGSKPRGEHGSITFCIEEMNPCWCFCNVETFCSTLSFSCKGNCWLSWCYTELNDCSYHLFSSEAFFWYNYILFILFYFLVLDGT